MFGLKAVILAGGFGTRLGVRYGNIPKPMAPLCGKPILQRQIETLRREGIKDFILVTHHLSEVIENYFGDGSDFGVNIEYFVEDEPGGTAGALKELGTDGDFLLCGGDLVMDFSLDRMVDFHKKNNALITLFTHPNTHPFDSTTLLTDSDNKVTGILSKADKPEFYPNLCNAGVQLVSPEVFRIIDIPRKADFDRDVIAPCIKTGRVFSYKSAEYVFDAGTPERMEKAELDINSSAVENSRFDVPHKAVFLDRDGTINRYKGYITGPEQLELIDGVSDAVSAFHRKGYLVIVITNQPVIARGECTVEELENIHCRLEALLAKDGAYLDAIYYCPHHPDRGFPGENEKYKIKCTCRKPGIGLIVKAQQDFNIDLSASFMAGDSITDIQAALNSGCTPIFIGDKAESLPEGTKVFTSLSEFSDSL